MLHAVAGKIAGIQSGEGALIPHSRGSSSLLLSAARSSTSWLGIFRRCFGSEFNSSAQLQFGTPAMILGIGGCEDVEYGAKLLPHDRAIVSMEIPHISVRYRGTDGRIRTARWGKIEKHVEMSLDDPNAQKGWRLREKWVPLAGYYEQTQTIRKKFMGSGIEAQAKLKITAVCNDRCMFVRVGISLEVARYSMIGRVLTTLAALAMIGFLRM